MLSVILLVACGGGGSSGGSSSGTTGNADNGKAIFSQAAIGSNPGCHTCHSLDGSQLIGPTLQGIASRAGTRVQGQSASDYIHASILDPNAYVVEGFAQGVMPTYKDALKDGDLNDLVAYLMTLK
jgi:mono/diheme cytochrome c family protein